MMTTRTLAERFRIPAQHPCLPGHFPGRPVVPGVVLLDRVIALLERAGMGSVQRIAVVKFVAPLQPDEDAEVTAIVDDARVRFRIERAGAAILAGEGELA